VEQPLARLKKRLASRPRSAVVRLDARAVSQEQ
jgi:hypothetical protein